MNNFENNQLKNINNMVDTLKEKFINNKALYVAFIVSFIAFITCYYFFQEFLAIQAGSFFGFMIVSTVAFLDTFVLKLDTYKEIKGGNIAYAIVFFSITQAVIFGYLVAFMAFLK